jgi:hypothetical protein
VAPFPNGGQEYQGTVHLVDPALVQQIEAVLSSSSSTGDYAQDTRAFCALCPDADDFLDPSLDHRPATAMSDATFVVANCPAIPGAGIDTPIARSRTIPCTTGATTSIRRSASVARRSATADPTGV